MFAWLWLIPLLPFAGFVLNGLLGARAGKTFVTWVGCGTVLLAFVLSSAAVWELATTDLRGWTPPEETGLRVSADHRRVELLVWEWFPAPEAPPSEPSAPVVEEIRGYGDEPLGGISEEVRRLRAEEPLGGIPQLDPYLTGGSEPARTAPPRESAAASTTAARERAGPAGDSLAAAPALRVPWLLTLDPLSSVMLLVVTGVGFLIHVYSTGYMGEDPSYWRFFAYLNLFMASMLTLVLGGAFPVMFVGWEGVGLCSYLLIGYWYEDENNAQAGRKAFMTNRIGDAGFILGVLLLWGAFGTMEMTPVMDAIAAGHAGVGGTVLTAAALLLFVGACGKSAQIPLYVWLPDAMAGPTPVSALIHAATMVTAGVYMVVRCSALYVASESAMAVVAVVGAATALFAATIGLAQDDIKKVLAYSTVSQLGYMMLGAGVGAFTGAIFHLTTHAFFKALLFLGAGAVIHALHHEQDMRKMGGLRWRLPWTYGTFLVGWLAIAGIFPLSGFWSKDEILLGAFVENKGLWAVGLVGAALTALYMTRLVGLTFWGESRVEAHVEGHVHEVPPAMKWVLVALAVLAMAGGMLGLPGKHILDDWLAPVIATRAHGAGAAGHAARGTADSMQRGVPESDAHAAGAVASSHVSPGAPATAGPGAQMEGASAAGAGGHHVSAALEVGLMAVSVAVAAIGIAIGWRYYRRGGGQKADSVARSAGGLYRLIRAKYKVDEIYDATVLKAYYVLCRLFNAVDAYAVDGAVNGAGSVAEVSGNVFRLFHTGIVRNYALFFLLGAAAVVWYLVA